MRTIIPILVISGLGIGTIIKYLKRYPRVLQWMFASIVVFVAITSLSISIQAWPTGFMKYMTGEGQPYPAGLDILANDTNIGTIIVNSIFIENKAEFLTLHDAFTIQSLVAMMFYFPEIQKFSGYYGGGLDFNKSLEESKNIRRAEMLKYVFEYTEGNSSYMGKLSNIILDEGRNNYYIREPKIAGLLDEMESDFIKRNFRMEMLSNTSDMVIYKLRR